MGYFINSSHVYWESKIQVIISLAENEPAYTSEILSLMDTRLINLFYLVRRLAVPGIINIGIDEYKDYSLLPEDIQVIVFLLNESQFTKQVYYTKNGIVCQ